MSVRVAVEQIPLQLILTKAIFILLLCLAIPVAIADQAENTEDEETEPLWEWRLAAFGHYGASYPASEDYQLNVLPLPYPIYRGKYLRLGDDRDKPIKSQIFRRDRVKLDLSFGLNFPVDSEDIDARTGMPDLDLLLEAGAELEMEFASPAPFNGRGFFSLELRPAFSFDGLDPTYQGIVLSPELTYRKKLAGRKDELKIHLTTAFANSKYMDFFYTVDPAFATPNRPAYEAKSGYLGTDFTVSWLNSLNESFELLIGGRLSSHHGAANDKSPLFTADMTYSVYAAFTWKFWESKRRVPKID
jgi:outer membrane scaffolding protein for murein synthesis (MipA/OmpV family)